METPAGPEENPCCWERLLRKQLLLLATLVAGVTYGAGINPPGGVWPENGPGHKSGDSIVLATDRRRYLAFYYCNTTALAASVVAIFLLLLEKPRRGPRLVILRIIMGLDLLGITGAYASGSSREFGLTLLILVFLPPVYLLMHILISRCYISPAAPQPQPQAQDQEELAALQHRARRKLLMLLASFTAAITYVSGLSPSNGYWNSVESNNQEGVQEIGALYFRANDRIMVFLYLNAIPFTASLWIVVLLLSNNSWMSALVLRPLWRWRTQPIKISAVIASILPHVLLLGMLGANIAGTYPMVKKMVVYQFGLLFMGITTWIFLVTCNKPCSTTAAGDEQGETVFELGSDAITRNEESRKVRSLILLLATLAATVTYQAGLHPPGGVWQEDGQTHRVGYPILLSTQPSRYKVFIYFNSGGFLLSVAAISMLTFNKRKIHTTLLVSMILDMVALMGAYTVGSWRDVRSSIYVVAMACSVIIYMMIHLLCVMKTTATMEMEGTRLMKKRHKRLLMVAILVATTTYQAGLNPPGSFRVHGDDSHAAGTVLLMDSYPRRLRAFLYCNTVSFMSTLALIIFFTSPNLYRRAVRCYPIYGCIVLALLCLLAAYTAGTTAKRVQTYAYVFVLLAMVVSAIGIHIIKSRAFLLRKEEEVVEDEHRSGAVFGHVHHIPRSRPRPRHIPRARLRLRSAQETKYRQEYTSHKHAVLLGILAAGATYQAGFNPPGGLWQDNGNPVLYDSDRKMYLAFFYCNYTSFMASIFVVTLHLLQEHIVQSGRYLMVIQMSTKITLVIDLLCLVAAYGAGVAKAELFT